MRTQRPNKTAFVRALPESMPANQVIAKAKAAGISLSARYIYKVRARTRTRRSATSVAALPSRKQRPSQVSRTEPAAQLVDLVMEHGLRRVEQALDDIRKRLKVSLLSGD